MSAIYSFLQKMKMHESNHGFIMIIAAYALSILMLTLGSDMFYNIKSTASGIELEETKKETVDKMGAAFDTAVDTKIPASNALPGLEYARASSRLRYTDGIGYASALIDPYGLDKESALQISTSGDTIWFLGKAMEGTTFDRLMEQVSLPADSEDLISTPDQKTEKEKAKNKKEQAKKDSKKSDSKKATKTISYATITLTEEEVGMLERIVEAEATGEDMVGKILVANVILNRIEDDEFPDTIKEVIFQKVNGKYQFSPISDKRYWSVKISDETEEAVQRALDGEDYSDGALYFMARKKAKKSSVKWFDKSLEWLFRHGEHEFYKNK